MEYYISRSHLLPRLISSIDGERSFFLKISIIIRDKMFNRISIEISAITVQLHGFSWRVQNF